jgi:hypothetical protein
VKWKKELSKWKKIPSCGTHTHEKKECNAWQGKGK